MATLIKNGQAGTLESGDVWITVAPGAPDSGLQVQLTSPVAKQYGRHIKAAIEEAVRAHDLQDVLVHANDKGALDCTIKARVRTALTRAMKEEAEK